MASENASRTRSRNRTTGALALGGLMMACPVVEARATARTAKPAASRATAPQYDASMWTHVRPQSDEALRLIEKAAGVSESIVSMLATLESSDVVVYLADAISGAFTGPSSSLVYVTTEGTTRYLMIRIDFARVLANDRIAALGHELHHALEVAQAPEVRDSATLAGLYRRIGWERVADRFESAAAQDAERRVRREIIGRNE